MFIQAALVFLQIVLHSTSPKKLVKRSKTLINWHFIAIAINVYTSSIGVFTDCSALYKPKKAGKTEQDSYQLAFYCNFKFTCWVSAHALTLNEYPDTKKPIRMFSSRIIIRIIRYPFQP